MAQQQHFKGTKRPASLLSPEDSPPKCFTRPKSSEPCATEHKDEKRNRLAELQACFNNAANKKLNLPTGYHEVAVLIVRWHEDIDAFKDGHDEEIARLEKLFQEEFHYKCETTKLNTVKKPQNTLNSAIARHIEKYDGPNNLLIIYYTGHGNLRNGDRLELSAKQQIEHRKGPGYHATAFWDLAEKHLMESAESDVLGIFDCCYASYAHKGAGGSRRSYEVLAASSRHEPLAYPPGKKSFTTALINSLEELLKSSGGRNFTTNKLVQHIGMKRKTPGIWDRLDTDCHIQLAPLSTDVGANSCHHDDRAWVTLRFSLQEQEVVEDQTEKLADSLPFSFEHAGLSLNKVEWLKFETVSSFAGAATSLLERVRRRSSTRSELVSETEDSAIRRRKRLSAPSPTTQTIQSAQLYVETGSNENVSSLVPLSSISVVVADSGTGEDA